MEHPYVIMVLTDLADTHVLQGNFEAAESDDKTALQITKARKIRDLPELRRVLTKFAKFLRKRGRIAEADSIEARIRRLSS